MKAESPILRCLYISYKKSDLSVRSKFSFSEVEITSLYNTLKEVFNIEEAFIISTCNRTELYYYHAKNISQQLMSFLCTSKGVENQKIFTQINDHQKSIDRLFEVGVGLNSQILGDQQIVNQFKKAYQSACDNNAAGVFFHKILHTLFYTNKRVVNETKFSTGQASIAYVTSQLINSFQLPETNILIIGVGEFGKEVTKNIHAASNAKITLSNRSIDKALALAKEVNAKVISFEHITEQLNQFDIVINCAHLKQFISKSDLLTQKYSYTYFIDLSVTGGIDKNVEQVIGNIHYNLDDLKDISDKSLEERRKAVPTVKAIIAEEVKQFSLWHQTSSFNPVLNQVKNTLDELRKKTISTQLKGMDDSELKIVNEITLKFVNELVKIPAIDLQQRCLRGENTDERIKLLGEIFGAPEKNLSKLKD